MQSRMRRLQLRGSGGFTPRFPNIAPAELRVTTIGANLEQLSSPVYSTLRRDEDH